MREYNLRPSPGQPNSGPKKSGIFQQQAKVFDDNSLMPWGKYKGVPLKDVPANYLLWLWENGVYSEKGKPLHNYISAAFSALESECPDLIIDHRPE
jgi:hypothetical protein